MATLGCDRRLDANCRLSAIGIGLPLNVDGNPGAVDVTLSDVTLSNELCKPVKKVTWQTHCHA